MYHYIPITSGLVFGGGDDDGSRRLEDEDSLRIRTQAVDQALGRQLSSTSNLGSGVHLRFNITKSTGDMYVKTALSVRRSAARPRSQSTSLTTPSDHHANSCVHTRLAGVPSVN